MKGCLVLRKQFRFIYEGQGCISCTFLQKTHITCKDWIFAWHKLQSYVHMSFINYSVVLNVVLRNRFLSMKQSLVGSLYTGISNILPFYDYRVFMPNNSCSFVLCFPLILFLYSFYGKNTVKGFGVVIQPTFLASYGELTDAFIHAGKENTLLSSKFLFGREKIDRSPLCILYLPHSCSQHKLGSDRLSAVNTTSNIKLFRLSKNFSTRLF